MSTLTGHKVKRLLNKFRSGQITLAQFKELKADFNNISDAELKDIISSEWEDFDSFETLPGNKINSIYQGLHINSKQKKHNFTITRHWMQIAASILFILAGGLITLLYNNHINSLEYEKFQAMISSIDEVEADTSHQVTLITDSANMIHIEKGATIAYSDKGKLSVNKKQVKTKQEKREEVNYNRLIVPKGKYSHLILSDGTEIYVNAGSKVVYPNKFTGKTREIYIDGEIALNVTKDVKHPFIVKTSDFDVRVLGTTFNVKSYKGINKAEIVLAEGSVSVTDKSEETITLVPNEMLSLSEGTAYNKKTVDAEDYLAWTKGRLPMTGKSLSCIMYSLSQFYGYDITFDKSVIEYPLYGTLDLQTSLDNVLERISKIIPIEIQKNKDGYHLYKSNKNINPKQ